MRLLDFRLAPEEKRTVVPGKYGAATDAAGQSARCAGEAARWGPALSVIWNRYMGRNRWRGIVMGPYGW